MRGRGILAAAATTGLLAVAACAPEPTKVRPEAASPVLEFARLDRYIACERANGPNAFQAIPAGDRLVAFDLHGDGFRQVSVIGSRNDALAVDVVSWRSGRAHVLRRSIRAPMPSAPVACHAAFDRRPGLLKAIERLDPTTLEAATVETTVGEASLLRFETLGRTQTCLYFHQEAPEPAVGPDTSPHMVTVDGLDCRETHDGVRDGQWRDLLPVIRSARRPT